MLGGFTFKGIHSSTFGVYQTPESRVLMPQKRRTLIDIPGRSEAFIQEDGGYNSRVESISCSYVPKEGEDLQRQIRKIAGWLSGVGELSFDYEPEMLYKAFLSSAPPTTKQMAMQYATFDLEFTINHPFAYERSTQKKMRMRSGQKISIDVDGTVQTPAFIIVKNLGNNAITRLSITNNIIKNSEG